MYIYIYYFLLIIVCSHVVELHIMLCVVVYTTIVVFVVFATNDLSTKA